jgi:hypothetical protein
MLRTWLLAVSGLMTSRPAISSLFRPQAIRRRISAIKRRVIPGDRSASPATITSIACSSSAEPLDRLERLARVARVEARVRGQIASHQQTLRRIEAFRADNQG